MVTNGNILNDVNDHVIKWDKMFLLNNILHMRPKVTMWDKMLSCKTYSNIKCFEITII